MAAGGAPPQIQNIISTSEVSRLVLMPAYTVKEVSTASIMIILFSAYACLYCQ